MAWMGQVKEPEAVSGGLSLIQDWVILHSILLLGVVLAASGRGLED